MDTKTELLIRELAEKLGTTGEHLWGVLVRQAPISVGADILYLATFGAVVWGIRYNWKRWAKERDALPKTDYDHGIWSYVSHIDYKTPEEYLAAKQAEEGKEKARHKSNALHTATEERRKELNAKIAPCVIAFWVMLALWLALAAGNFANIAAGLFNPEYWALKQILP